MKNVIVAVGFVLLLSGTAVAQKKPAKRTATNESKIGTTATNDVIRADPSAANTHDGTQAATINTTNKGTGLTNEQRQSADRPAKRTVNIKSSNGTMPMNDQNGANQSAVSAQDTKTNVPAGIGGIPSGTGLTNDQNQAANSSVNRTTKVDAESSVRTSPSTVKPKKKALKKHN